MQDGQRHFLVGEFSNFVRPQLPCKIPKDAAMIRDKVIPVRRMGYIETGEVCSLAHYFHVPKGPDDIRMVYNGTGCGLNASLWAPHFGLPYVTHTTRSLMPGYC